MAQNAPSELTPAYRTLDEPTKLLGLSLAQWAAIAVAGGIAYACLLISPLPWRLNASLVVVLMGAPLMVALLREQGALTAPQLFRAVSRWRLRPALLVESRPETSPAEGAVVLDEPAEVPADQAPDELPWLDPPAGAT